MNTTDSIAPISHMGTLAALRSLAHGSTDSMENMLQAASRQARLLRGLLPNPIRQLPARLTSLIPSVVTERVADIPVSGMLFWANRQWHIHVRSTDPLDTQAVTVLHQLKHIIDHPLRRSVALSDAEWETLADHFVQQVLACEPSQVSR